MTRDTTRWRLRDAQQTEQIGAALCAALRPGDFIGLSGPLGAGKTCITRGILAGLRPEPGHDVSSPTYTLMNHYKAQAPFVRVLHADLYRLEDMDDLESTGYWDAIEEADLALVEWIDKLPAAWPREGFDLRLDYDQGQTRSLELRWRGAGGQARLEVARARINALLGAP